MNTNETTQLAYKILMLDENGEALLPTYLSILENGLGTEDKISNEKQVTILGAGISGLMAGFLLKQAGYQVTILEANPSRIGGRIKTFHPRFEKESPFLDPNQYSEGGAMRFPTSHPLLQKTLDIFGLRPKVRPFYNVAVDKNSPTQRTFKTWVYANGYQIRLSDYADQSAQSQDQNGTLGFPLEERFLDKTASQLLDEALAEPNSWISDDLPLQQRVQGWVKIIENFGQYSMRHYLKHMAKYPDPVIDYIGTIENLSSRFFLSFIQNFLGIKIINAQAQFDELEGGSWQLPYALYEHLKDNVILNAKVVAINTQQTSGVTITTENEQGQKDYQADYVICTLPFPCLRFININPLFSYDKHRAIIDLHYDSSTKVLLEFSERFWEWDEATWKKNLTDPYRGHDSLGGASITDLANRYIYFPSHPVKGSKGGVVIASYTWSDDANRWDSMPFEERYQQALEGISRVYGQGIKAFYTGRAKTQSWMEDQYAFGEAAIFAPGQLESIHNHIAKPEGNIHFAGDHTSLKHAWIEGALESAMRVVCEIHQKVYQTQVTQKTASKHPPL